MMECRKEIYISILFESIYIFFTDTGSLKLRKTPFGLDVYAPENSEVDDRKKYQLIGTARGSGFARGPGSTLRPGKTLVNLRFTLLDNDGNYQKHLTSIQVLFDTPLPSLKISNITDHYSLYLLGNFISFVCVCGGGEV